MVLKRRFLIVTGENPGPCGLQCFIETLVEVFAKTGWQVHSYVILQNHFHLVVETRSRIWSPA
jgi:hypothetical protein